MQSNPDENAPTHDYEKLLVQLREFRNVLNVPGSYDFIAGVEVFLTSLDNLSHGLSHR